MKINQTKRADFQIISEWIGQNTKVLDLGCGDGALLNFLISNIIESNNEHLNWTVNQLLSLKNNNNLEKIVLVGAAFKENTDDLRNSPTLDIYKILSKMEIEVIILDQMIEVPEHSHVSSIDDIASNSLVSIMYPQKDDFISKLNKFCSKNNCVIYYPWS